jgi:hypothetical protein
MASLDICVATKLCFGGMTFIAFDVNVAYSVGRNRKFNMARMMHDG